MHRRVGLFFCAAVIAITGGAGALAADVSGDYVETRSADVYTGPCFANGEVGLTGSEATLAWKIRQGSWSGVRLDGLTVVAVTKASATLGDPYNDPYPAKAVLILDANATPAQSKALVDFARAMAGRLLENVVAVHAAPISFTVGEGHLHGSAVLKAGDIAAVETRPLDATDHICGNETTYYPPLTELSHRMPVVAAANEFSGTGLDTRWRISGKRSAFVGTFHHAGKLTRAH